MPFLPIIDRPNSIGEINCFLRRVVLQNGISLLTGAKSRVTLTDEVCLPRPHSKEPMQCGLKKASNSYRGRQSLSHDSTVTEECK